MAPQSVWAELLQVLCAAQILHAHSMEGICNGSERPKNNEVLSYASESGRLITYGLDISYLSIQTPRKEPSFQRTIDKLRQAPVLGEDPMADSTWACDP